MSTVFLKNLPAIRLAADTKQKKKRKELLKAFCDKDFANAIHECCWNVVNCRVPLSSAHKRRLVKHKKLLRGISNKSTSLKKRKALIQSGGFASLLPLLVGPVVSLLGSLIKR